MIAADAAPGRRLRGPAVRAERRDGRRPRARRRPRHRVLPPGGLRRRPESRPRRRAAAARTPCSQTVENASWAIGPLLGGALTAAAGPSAAYAINARLFVVSIALLVRIPPRLLQSERALSRGHWRDLADGFVAALRSPSMRAVLVGWGIASLALGGTNVAELFLAKNTLLGRRLRLRAPLRGDRRRARARQLRQRVRARPLRRRARLRRRSRAHGGRLPRGRR